MKALNAVTLLTIVSSQMITGCSSQQRQSALLLEGRSVAAWVSEVDIGTLPDAKNPGLDVLTSAGPRVIPDLALFLRQAEPSSIRAKAAFAMGVIAYRNPDAPEARRAVPALTASARSDDSEVQIYSVQALGAIGKAASDATTDLIRLTRDTDAGVRMSAVNALGRIGVASAEVTDALNRAVSDPSGDVQITSVLALRSFGQSESNTIPVLVRLVTNESVGVRMLAIETLGRIGANSPDSVAALELALSDTNSGIRVFADAALKTIRAERQ